jgi:hypothetical protein
MLAGSPEPDLDLLLAAYHEEWQQRDLGRIAFGKKDNIESLSQLAERILARFVETDFARPEGRVLGVEEELRDRVIDGCPDLLARLDLVVETDEAVVITDFKTSRSRWNQQQAEQAGEQLLLYSELVRDLVPEKPVHLEFVVITKTKTPSIEWCPFPNDPQQVDRVKKMVERVWSGIDSGLFYPSPSPLACGGCPFQEPCRDWCG